jgi:protein-S-isoprenylcysteine O-methyltransferase Ste14
MQMERSWTAWIVIGTWWTFLIYWLISAFNVKRTLRREGLGPRLIVLASVGWGCQMIFSSFAANLDSRRVIPQSVTLDLLTSALAIAGLAVTIWARRTLAGNWSASVTLKEGHELVQAGPYRFVRHPIYSGFFLMALAAALVPCRMRGFAGFGLTVLGFWYKLRREEALMMSHFPDDYPRYKSRVKAIVPWVV